MVSFIISLDNSYEMCDNFFTKFLSNDFVKNSEVIVVIDGNYDLRIRQLLDESIIQNPNLKVYYIEKCGYGRANNIGVCKSTGDYLFFINCDIFTDNKCFELMYETLVNGIADCVQPLLIYPQTNLVQCAGTFFGQYFKDHLFDGNKITSKIVNIDGPRQALTSALYAMKKETFNDVGGFDEFYYNKLEGFELSYKIHLSGKKCWYLSQARAWHSRGGGRNKYSFDFRQQEAYFWSRFGNNIKPDIEEYLALQLDFSITSHSYYTIIVSQIRSWANTLSKIGIKSTQIYEMPWVGPAMFNLWDILPNSFLSYPEPILFVVENIRFLNNNKYWFQIRGRKNDIAIDRYANLIQIYEYLF